jgi:hypothetical protein
MAGVQGSALTVAVSNACGLGSLPCAMLGLDALRKELTAIRAQTARPFNVNFFCHAQPQPNAEREAAWLAALSPYFEELGIDPNAIPTGPARTPFSSEAADVLAELRPAVVASSTASCGNWADECCRARFSPGCIGHRAVARQGREPRQQRLLTPMGGPEHYRLPRGLSGSSDSRVGRSLKVEPMGTG